MNVRRFVVLSTLLGYSLAGSAQVPQDQSDPEVELPKLGLTVYSAADPAQFDPQQFIAQQSRGNWNALLPYQVPGFGVVHDVRTLALEQGANTVEVTDVAAFIDPTSVTLADLSVGDTGGGVSVLAQSFAFDLLSPDKLLEKFVDQPITVRLPRGDADTELVTGTLLSANGGSLVLQTAEGLRIVPGFATDSRGQGAIAQADLQLPALPDNFVTRPTLRWTLDAPTAGARIVRTTYQTNGLTWRADYTLLVDDAQDATTTGELSAWVTLMNLSGASYEDAQLKLVAGDVRRITPNHWQRQHAMAMAPALTSGIGDSLGFEQKSFAEYHLYTLPRPATLPDQSTHQLALFPPKPGVAVVKQLVFDPLAPQMRNWRAHRPYTEREFQTPADRSVEVYLRFENEKDNALGVPLPAGKVRVYQRDDADGTPEFIGEDVIQHTPEGLDVSVRIGSSFDVTATRTQSDFKIDVNPDMVNWMEDTIEIELKNARKTDVEVVVREPLFRWVNWEILESSHEYTKVDARTVQFPVTVPGEGSATVRYGVRYSW